MNFKVLNQIYTMFRIRINKAFVMYCCLSKKTTSYFRDRHCGNQSSSFHIIHILVLCTQMSQRKWGRQSWNIRFSEPSTWSINASFPLHFHISQFPGVTIKTKMTNCSVPTQDNTRSPFQCKSHPSCLAYRHFVAAIQRANDDRESKVTKTRIHLLSNLYKDWAFSPSALRLCSSSLLSECDQLSI